VAKLQPDDDDEQIRDESNAAALAMHELWMLHERRLVKVCAQHARPLTCRAMISSPGKTSSTKCMRGWTRCKASLHLRTEATTANGCPFCIFTRYVFYVKTYKTLYLTNGVASEEHGEA
jgi:hypothetical protein